MTTPSIPPTTPSPRSVSSPAPRAARSTPTSTRRTTPAASRSEERRVGKECRSRWSAHQAEDGIRDLTVTGVQTCALPISRSAHEVVELDTRTGRARVIGAAHDDTVDPAHYPEPQIRVFTGPEGREIHAHVYPPHNPGCVEIGRASCRERV